MNTTIEKEIIDYLKENDMYYVEEYDDEGFPIDNGAHEFVGDLTKAELCDMTIESMEYIAEVQSKIDIEKVYHAFEKILSKEMLDNIRKILEE